MVAASGGFALPAGDAHAEIARRDVRFRLEAQLAIFRPTEPPSDGRIIAFTEKDGSAVTWLGDGQADAVLEQQNTARELGSGDRE